MYYKDTWAIIYLMIFIGKHKVEKSIRRVFQYNRNDRGS